VVAHALLFRWRGLQLGRLVRRRRAIGGSGCGLSAVGRLAIAVLVGLVLIASLNVVPLIVVYWLALPLMNVLALVPLLRIPSIAISR